MSETPVSGTLTEAHPFRVLGISGSLRKQSTNTMALRNAQKLAPAGLTLALADLSDIPLYNADLLTDGEPESVIRLKRQIREADAVLMACPEYNFSVTGALKNALDWVSRPPDAPFNEKPVAIMGVSPGPVGTARAQYHLRQILVFMNAFTLNKPEVFIPYSAEKFNAEGELTDPKTAQYIRDQLSALRTLAMRVNG